MIIIFLTHTTELSQKISLSMYHFCHSLFTHPCAYITYYRLSLMKTLKGTCYFPSILYPRVLLLEKIYHCIEMLWMWTSRLLFQFIIFSKTHVSSKIPEWKNQQKHKSTNIVCASLLASTSPIASIQCKVKGTTQKANNDGEMTDVTNHLTFSRTSYHQNLLPNNTNKQTTISISSRRTRQHIKMIMRVDKYEMQRYNFIVSYIRYTSFPH